jgi:hypothetical protein
VSSAKVEEAAWDEKKEDMFVLVTHYYEFVDFPRISKKTALADAKTANPGMGEEEIEVEGVRLHTRSRLRGEKKGLIGMVSNRLHILWCGRLVKGLALLSNASLLTEMQPLHMWP